MKKIKYLILILIISLSFNINVIAVEDNEQINNTNNETSEVTNTDSVDTDDKVYDFADLFSESEEENLYNDIYKYKNKTTYEAIIVTTNDNNGKYVEDYAMDFYEDNGFARNGIIFVIDMQDRGYTVMAHGDAINTYTDNDIDYILDEVYYDMAAGDYYDAASNFLYLATKYYSSDSSYTYDDSYYDDYSANSINWLELIISPLIVTIVIILILAFRNRMVKKANSSKSFLNDKTKVITTISDIFLGSTTTKVRIDTSSSSGGGSSSGRSGGGRSSGMRSSSSGGSFRGGSRRF